MNHLCDGADVGRSGPAAAADEVEPAMEGEFFKLGGERIGGFEIETVFVGETGVGVAGNARGGELMEGADVIRHEIGAGGAVEADGEQIDVGEGGPKGVGGLAGEHGAGGFDGAGDHGGDTDAAFDLEAAEGEEGGLDVAGVLGGFDEDDVGSAVEKAARGVVIIGLQLGEGDVARDGDGACGWAHGAGDEAGLGGRGEFAGCLAGEAGGVKVDFVGFGGDVVFAEGDGVGVEGIGFDDVGAGFVVGAVDVEDDVGTGEDEMIVAAFERESAEIRGGEVALLDHGAHGAVEHEDAGGEGIFERLLARSIQGEVLRVWADGEIRPVVLF